MEKTKLLLSNLKRVGVDTLISAHNSNMERFMSEKFARKSTFKITYTNVHAF